MCQKRNIDKPTELILYNSSLSYIQVKVQVMFTLERAKKAQRVSRDIALLFL